MAVVHSIASLRSDVGQVRVRRRVAERYYLLTDPSKVHLLWKTAGDESVVLATLLYILHISYDVCTSSSEDLSTAA